MRFTAIILIGAFAAGTIASRFEPVDFNVTQALLDNGVQVAAIPGLAGLVNQSSPNACSIAVSHQVDSRSCMLIMFIVWRSAICLR
jgi:hypothetical protein